MNNLTSQFKQYVDEFANKHNFSLHVSEPYNLFPIGKEFGFNDPWPFNQKAGCYLIFGESHNLIYVGQAKQLGKRLADHFGSGKKCNIKEIWSERPKIIITIEFLDDENYGRHSLEAYLIKCCKPSDNTSGKE